MASTPKFKKGDIVTVVKVNNHKVRHYNISISEGELKVTAEQERIERERGILGETGVVAEVSRCTRWFGSDFIYALDYIPAKYAWYDENELDFDKSIIIVSN